MACTSVMDTAKRDPEEVLELLSYQVAPLLDVFFFIVPAAEEPLPLKFFELGRIT